MNTEHRHCPVDGNHRHPLTDVDGRAWCGPCWYEFGRRVERVLCTPETCPGMEATPGKPGTEEP